MGLCREYEVLAKVLERVNAIRTIETFRFVLLYLDDPELAEPACKSAVEVAHNQKLRDSIKEEFVKSLDKVIATTKDAEIVEWATRYKEGKTWERKKGRRAARATLAGRREFGPSGFNPPGFKRVRRRP